MKLKALLLGLALLASTPAFAQQNAPVTPFPSAARVVATSDNSPTYTNYNWRGLQLRLEVTAETGTSTLDCKLQGQEVETNDYYDLVDGAFTQMTGVGAAILSFYPSLEEDAASNVNGVLPYKWRAVCAVGGTGMTFSLSGTELL